MTVDDKHFWTPVFLIRFEDEEMPLNLGCVFRCEVSAENPQPIQVVVELLFYDKKLIADIFDPNMPQIVSQLRPQFNVVSQCTLEVINPLKFNKAYFPLEFDTLHFCLVQSILISTPTSIQ